VLVLVLASKMSQQVENYRQATVEDEWLLCCEPEYLVKYVPALQTE